MGKPGDDKGGKGPSTKGGADKGKGGKEGGKDAGGKDGNAGDGSAPEIVTIAKDIEAVIDQCKNDTDELAKAYYLKLFPDAADRYVTTVCTVCIMHVPVCINIPVYRYAGTGRVPVYISEAHLEEDLSVKVNEAKVNTPCIAQRTTLFLTTVPTGWRRQAARSPPAQRGGRSRPPSRTARRGGLSHLARPRAAQRRQRRRQRTSRSPSGPSGEQHWRWLKWGRIEVCGATRPLRLQ